MLVLATDAVSMSFTSCAGFAGFNLGEAGWKRVGGFSLGKTASEMSGITEQLWREVETYDSDGSREVR